ncbi:UDP-4-amino-4-deoxy-L-arabinose--oxoglutarate aminotransferase [bacterium BMS3Abin07]|nr:UDP-4-amino-4-deoxy-L-arabinose--oxoglutarate aminotransferase [bacterium BMS3Abin07]GBE32212.1 UDP-4-amino-4-deoxy-L-arabinose--oxoglutarate aminotransferase [bacterium BMS3Bbin05]HDL20020.1 DegT/DnrJ/EryC1/StrS family aminotransferase [Nitrospirota bacterium]HDO22875.1 DegT/DnrJ/EryC1/StrS family aminotransferase [Nitrospirota bacterium]HDZ88164.1 DegT/DnrJ/EryC1/StrS family aminotransferase [Nitrospirota bacterium]
MKVEFYRHNIDNEDVGRIEGVLNSVFLTTGAVAGEFEERFSSYLDIPYAVGVTSCTAALHLSLVAWAIGAGDEVITTPMSFCATSNAILHAGAKPVFVDVEEDTGNINADLIEGAITERTKAVIPVHLYGRMCDMKKIRRIADKHGLVVIEDAAHAIEAERDGIRVGKLADSACFSFYATKNITSGEGGAVCVHDRDKAEILKMLRLHGIDKSAADRYTKQYRHWDMPFLGWKYNMDNLQAALLIGQLKRIDLLWERRKVLWDLYTQSLAGLDTVQLAGYPAAPRHAMHLFTVLVDGGKRDEILNELQKRGIGVAVNYRPIHLLKYYRDRFSYKSGDFPVAEAIGNRTISLPFYPRLSEDELTYVSDTLKSLIT